MMMALILTLAAAAYRLMDHPWNVAPLGALALMGGLYFGRRYALLVPLAALAVTDVVLNLRMGYGVFHAARLFDYGVFALIGLLGMWCRTQKHSVKFGAAFGTPFLFYFVSNFGVWLFGLSLANVPYPKTFAGLIECYAAGLPFLRGTLVGDYLFMAIFAGTMAAVLRRELSRLPVGPVTNPQPQA
jgi:hypothetical protein